MSLISRRGECRTTRPFWTILALCLLIVTPSSGHAQILKKIKDAAAQKAAERARHAAEQAAAAAAGVTDSALAKTGRIVDLREVTMLPLRFTTNTDSLAQGQSAMLDVLAIAVSQLPGNYRLDVYVADWPDAQAALLHSTRRADAVRAALIGRGIDSTRLAAFGRGIGLATRIELKPAS